MADTFLNMSAGLDSPANDGALIAPSDGADLAFVTRAIWVGGAGNIACVMRGGQTVTYMAVPAGFAMPIRVARVLLTGTTATNLIAMW